MFERWLCSVSLLNKISPSPSLSLSLSLSLRGQRCAKTPRSDINGGKFEVSDRHHDSRGRGGGRRDGDFIVVCGLY